MKVVPARHFPSGEMRLAVAVCVPLCMWHIFLIVILFGSPIFVSAGRACFVCPHIQVYIMHVYREQLTSMC